MPLIFGWRTTTKDNCRSLFLNGNPLADIEHFPLTYWQITYYDRDQGRVQLRFAFEDASLSEAEIRLKVENKTRDERREKRACLGQMQKIS